MPVAPICQKSRLPVSDGIEQSVIAGIVERHASDLVRVIRDALTDTAPDLSRYILDNGIMLTGGSATVALLGRAIARATGLKIRIADKPLHCVVAGLGALA